MDVLTYFSLYSLVIVTDRNKFSFNSTFPVKLWVFVPIKGTPPVLQNTDPCSVSALVQLEKRLLSQHVQCLWP